MSKRGWIYLILSGLLIIGVGAQIGLRFLEDRATYNQAHASYLKADCKSALPLYSRVIEAWHVMDAGGYVALAKQEEDDCVPFVRAEEIQASGDLPSALFTFRILMKASDSPVLAEAARQRAVDLLVRSPAANLVDAQNCSDLDGYSVDSLLSNPSSQLPALYFACGDFYDGKDQRDESLKMYIRVLEDFSGDPLAERSQSAVVMNPTACQQREALESSPIAGRADFLPSLYYNCIQMFEATSEHDQAYDLYLRLFTSFPAHSLTTQARDALPGNAWACNRYESFSEALAADPEFLPNFLYKCGQAFENGNNSEAAITMYQVFIDKYPSHALLTDVKSALTSLLVEMARQAGADEIEPPQRTGTVGGGATVVTIQNDSPEKLRIVFSGPDPRIEELPPCEMCEVYSLTGPLFCPEKGPIGNYTLLPGEYDVLVEASSDTGVTPFTGHWDLKDSDSYYNCFVIIRRFTINP